MENVVVRNLVVAGKLKLTNGSVVVVYDNNGIALRSFMVTSFRSGKDFSKTGGTGAYCSLINLETGYIEFEEPSSRETTEKRICSHLHKGLYQQNSNQDFSEGLIVKVYKRDEYKIDIKGI